MPLNSIKQLEQQHLQKKTLMILCRLAPFQDNIDILPSHLQWPTTRQLADEIGISIYKMRHLLLEMRAQGLVLGHKSNNKTLHWFPTK
ncbi:hypothetical protein SMQC19_46620 (plasmid) [Serratia marcescens]|nr:hypothetical protein SMQC19_46620 [Serratia marcescens]